MTDIKLHYTPMEMIPEHVAHLLTDKNEKIPIQAGVDLYVYLDPTTGSVVFDASHNPRETQGAAIRINARGNEKIKAVICSPLFGTSKSAVLGWNGADD